MKLIMDLLEKESMQGINQFNVIIECLLIVVVCILMWSFIKNKDWKIFLSAVINFAISIMIHITFSASYQYEHYMEQGSLTIYYLSIAVNVLGGILILFGLYKAIKTIPSFRS